MTERQTIGMRKIPTGFLDNLTPEQDDALKLLKEKLNTSDFATDIFEHPDGDRWILRFLRATMNKKERKFNVDAAFDRLTVTYRWRKEYKVDEIRKQIENGDPPIEELNTFNKYHPRPWAYNQETGDVMEFNRFGLVASNINDKVLTIEQWNIALAASLEFSIFRLRQQSQKHGREISTYLNFVDATGVSLSGIYTRRKFVQIMSHICEQHYPEILGKTFICLTPWYFSKIFDMIKPFIDKDTLAKMHLSSNVPLDEIDKVFPKTLILKEYGGDNEEVVLAKPVF